MSNIALAKEKTTLVALRDQRTQMIKQAEEIGGYNFASISPALQESNNEQSSVDLSVEENIEEVEMME